MTKTTTPTKVTGSKKNVKTAVATNTTKSTKTELDKLIKPVLSMEDKIKELKAKVSTKTGASVDPIVAKSREKKSGNITKRPKTGGSILKAHNKMEVEVTRISTGVVRSLPFTYASKTTVGGFDITPTSISKVGFSFTYKDEQFDAVFTSTVSTPLLDKLF